MRTLKTMAIASAMLFGATQVMAQAPITDGGTFTFKVVDESFVACTDAAAKLTTLTSMTLGANATDAQNATAEILCDITTNLTQWDLEFSTVNGGFLKDGSNEFKTDEVTNGALLAWVHFISVGAGNSITAIEASSGQGGTALTTNLASGKSLPLSTPTKLANLFEQGADAFKSSQTGTNIFQIGIKGGVKGTKVTSGPGNYTETINIEFHGPVI